MSVDSEILKIDVESPRCLCLPFHHLALCRCWVRVSPVGSKYGGRRTESETRSSHRGVVDPRRGSYILNDLDDSRVHTGKTS